jgi:hypothetical protein
MIKKFNTEEVKLLVKALPFKTLYNLLGRDDVSSELGQLLLVEYQLRDTINKPNSRV